MSALGKNGGWLAAAALGAALMGHASAAWAEGQPRRSEAHQNYAEKLWEHVRGYSKWRAEEKPVTFDFGPPVEDARCYVKPAEGAAQDDDQSLPRGTLLVHEHRGADGQVRSVTAYFRANADRGYGRYSDWYWAHYGPDGTVIKTVADRAAHDKRGFVTAEYDGRLWVWDIHAPDAAEFVTKGEVDKHATLPGAGPGGMTVKGPDSRSITLYLVKREGFETVIDDGGRLWVFRAGSPEWEEFQASGEPARFVIRPAAGPRGITIKSPDAETIDAYLGTST